MSMFNKAINGDAKDVSNESKLAAAPKGKFIATLVGVSFKPASPESQGGMSFAFKAPNYEKYFWVNGNPADKADWAKVDKRGTLGAARKKGMIGRTIGFIEVLHALGVLGQLAEADLSEGDNVGDWAYLTPLRTKMGKAALVFNCGEYEGKPTQFFAAYPRAEYTPPDLNALQLSGARELQLMFNAIPKDCVSWVVQRLNEGGFVTLESNQYRLRIESMKENTEDGKSELRFMCSAWGLDDALDTDGRKCFLKLNLQREGDVMILQSLAQIVGSDEKQIPGKFLDAFIIKGVGKGNNGEFNWNYIEDVYPVDKTVAREGLPTGEYNQASTQPTALPSPSPSPKPTPSESPMVVQAQDDVTLDPDEFDNSDPFADD